MKYLISSIMFFCISVQLANATPIQWTVANGGNGHWYELVPNAWTTWQEARTNVQTRTHLGFPCDLATITSEAETLFIEEAFHDSGAWTCWLGGYQYPSGSPLNENWHWISQWEGTPYEENVEEWNYTNWLPNEPNFTWEDGLSLYLNHTDVSSPSGWNNAARNGTNSYGYSALVEYVPEPATLGLLTMGGMVFLKRRKV